MNTRGAMSRLLHSARVYDGTAAGAEERTHGPGRTADMGQREDVQASLNAENRDRRESPVGRRAGERVGVRAGWRARLAHVENLLTICSNRPVHGETLMQALREVREMLDEIPQIGISQRAPVEVPPVRESER